MKSRLKQIMVVCCGMALAGVQNVLAQPSREAVALAAQPEKAQVVAMLERVADWQLANPAKYPSTDWTQAVLYCGLMKLQQVSSSPRFQEAMLRMGEANQWQLGPEPYFADDHCVGQTYLELLANNGRAEMVNKLKERFDYILVNPKDHDLDFTRKDKIDRWSWCDSLFMAPPTWLRLYSLTNDKRYLDFAIEHWWVTSDYLYDPTEGLYFRDSTYFKLREANGKKVFWSRGNGWVIASLARILPLIPQNHPARERFVKQFKEMAQAVLKCQQPDGFWRTSLLDPSAYPSKESSGTGFFCFALAWGINEGLLSAEEYRPAVDKSWKALVECVSADGRFTQVQPPGKAPKTFDANNTEPYGTGAFLLAGVEVLRLR